MFDNLYTIRCNMMSRNHLKVVTERISKFSKRKASTDNCPKGEKTFCGLWSNISSTFMRLVFVISDKIFLDSSSSDVYKLTLLLRTKIRDMFLERNSKFLMSQYLVVQ